ncbi:hypothetical protein [Rhodanobacter sp. C03]|uniref:hypothetical protein n=1 Tax=Rhodanobacter sp. C03 TaxID=1945858 RepID=UPI001115917C|nr:hypothetical protein [Rhodanobacter sp. C03]
MSIGRTFRVDAQIADQQGRTKAPNAVFGAYWDLDVPYMVGTFDAIRGWVSAAQPGVNGLTASDTLKRCSEGGSGPPGTLGIGQFNLIFYNTYHFFSGININIPGSGMQEELIFPGNLVSENIGGNTYFYKTKNNWMVSCLGSIQNGSGEGFVVKLPDGRTYNFDWMVSQPYPYIFDDTCGTSINILTSPEAFSSPVSEQCTAGYSLPRAQVFLYATKATDRFGNTVTYTYDPSNPGHLLQVSSSDGGLISVAYGSNGLASTITAGSRQWTYGYDSASNAITSVTLPDGSSWSMNYGQNTVGVTQYLSKAVWLGCHINIGTETTDVAPGPNDTNTVTMTHPSGAVGTFEFRKILHGTREAEPTCAIEPLSASAPWNTSTLIEVPSDYQTASLVSKTLTIPGALTQQWTYQYHPGWVPPLQSVTTVTDSAQTVRKYTYGSDRALNFGELLQETDSTPSGLLRTVTYQYLNSAVGQNFADSAGLPLALNTGWESGFHDLNRPLYSTTITQQGKSFSKTIDTGCPSAGVYCFDSLVRPTRVIRSSQ